MLANNFSGQFPIIGIDEAGRGPLAGPLVVGGVKVLAPIPELAGIKDSKKLSPKMREEWFEFLTRHPNIVWGVTKVWPKAIDTLNIYAAANFGARRIYKKLSPDFCCPALLDGSLYLPPKAPFATIIKGDEKIPAIAAASVIAKVIRDRTMVKLHKKFPEYGFDKHKGYATKLHCAKVRELGYSDLHRKSFKIHSFEILES